MKIDLARRIHVPCTELGYPDDVRSGWSDTKVTQLQYEELDLCQLIVKINLILARS